MIVQSYAVRVYRLRGYPPLGLPPSWLGRSAPAGILRRWPTPGSSHSALSSGSRRRPRPRCSSRSSTTLQHWLWTDLPDALGESGPPWYLVLGLPVAGGAIVWAGADASCPATADTRRFTASTPPPRRCPTRRASSSPRSARSGSGSCSVRRRPSSRSGPSSGVALDLVRPARRQGGQGPGDGRRVRRDLGPVRRADRRGRDDDRVGRADARGGARARAPAWLRRRRDRLRDLRRVRQLGGLDTPGLAVPNLPLYDGTRVVDLFFAVVVGVVTAIAIAAVTRFATGRGRRAG